MRLQLGGNMSSRFAFGIRLVTLTLLVLGLGVVPAAHAANQLYKGSWVAHSFGNDFAKGTGTHDPESNYFSVFGMPQGVLCNAGQPRCPLASTPVSTPGGNFSALGNFCTPVTAWKASRPAKGATPCTVTAMGGCQPFPQTPRYRNPFFFKAGGSPKTTSCTATTTISGAKATAPLTTNSTKLGVVMRGKPVSGVGIASMSPVAVKGAVSFPPAPVAAGGTMDGAACTKSNVAGNCGGIRRTTIGEFNNIFPYVYSYTYATLRNASGVFASGSGPGNFTVTFMQGANKVAQSRVVQGANKFGGTMKLLGQLTTKVCYFRNGGCSLGGMDWRYDLVGTLGATPSLYTSGGVITAGYPAKFSGMYYHTALMQASTVMLVGSRFPWTTGTASVTAVGRGPHNTVAVRKGYDKRTAGGKGTIQLVSPVMSRWNQTAANFETAGVAVLRLEFVPEPGKWMLLVAGLSSLAVVYRARRR
jgi:hypothetical protein